MESGEGGFLTRTFDEFADRIADLVRDPALRARLGGTEVATLARFGWDIVTEQYLNIYRQAMAKIIRVGDGVALTVDVEPDCPPYLTSFCGIDEGLPRLLTVLEEAGVSATFS